MLSQREKGRDKTDRRRQGVHAREGGREGVRAKERESEREGDQTILDSFEQERDVGVRGWLSH